MEVLFYLVILGFVFYYFYCEFIVPVQIENRKKKNAKLSEELSGIMKYERVTGTLSINKRSPRIRELLTVDDDREEDIQYEPETLHVGSVSVGNVTTGGAYITGGYNYSNGWKKTGKAIMLYGEYPVARIRLTEELSKKASTSSIKKYLDPKTKEIKIIEKWYPSQYAMNKYFDTNDMSDAMMEKKLLNHNRDYVMPSFEKCHEIIDWLCSSQ